MYGPLRLKEAVDRIMAALSADTPTLATVNTNVLARLPDIKNIQMGTITVDWAANSDTATITAVVLANSIILFLGHSGGNAGRNARIELTNTTTVTAFANSTVSNQDTVVVGYLVLEFN